MTDAILKLLVFFLVGAGMAAVPVTLSFLLWRNRKESRIKSSSRAQAEGDQESGDAASFSKEYEPYESGMPPEGSGRAVGFEYLIYAVLFLLFDVIAVLAFLGTLALRESRSAFLWPFLTLAGLALILVAYGVKKRDYLKI